jgi:starch phosphorylase
VPITSITNGVHAPTWVDRRMQDLAGKYIGNDPDTDPAAWERAADIPDEDLWAVRRQMRTTLVEEARRRVRVSWLERGASPAELGWVDSILDPDVLTLGFARRVPTYKRLTLMLRDSGRLRAMLLNPDRPVQLVIAGKSHPADDHGKKLIQQMVKFADDPAVRHRIVFLPNYDIAMAQSLYPGCDVWLNNPLRPLEACGTSGMKAALNGGLNLSILDGWWDEWYDGKNGWAIPTADGVDDPNHRDDLEAAALYDLIENSVASRFYDRDSRGLPTRWLEMVRHTITSLGPKVLATRMVSDYVQQLYVPSARAGRQVDVEAAQDLADYRARIRSGWSTIKVDHVESLGVADSAQVGDEIQIRAFVTLGELRPEEVEVQVVYGKVTPADVLVDSATQVLHLADTYEAGRYRYEGVIRLHRTGPFGYTVRVLPRHELMATPAEFGLVINA